jgi:hypothetical protein
MSYDSRELPPLPAPISSSKEQDAAVLRNQFACEEVSDAWLAGRLLLGQNTAVSLLQGRACYCCAVWHACCKADAMGGVYSTTAALHSNVMLTRCTNSVTRPVYIARLFGVLEMSPAYETSAALSCCCSCARLPGWLQDSTASQHLQDCRSCSCCCSTAAWALLTSQPRL